MQQQNFPSSPLGLHRVIEPAGALPQAAWRLDPSPVLWPDEARDPGSNRLNLDAASFRQLTEAAAERPNGVNLAAALRGAVLSIVAERGKMQNPVTGSGGMLTGVVEEAGPDSPLGLAPGDRVATLVSLSLTPLAITDGLARWDGRSEQVPCDGHAILFGRSIAAVLPDDLPVPLALAVLDVCGAPALTSRVVRQAAAGAAAPAVAILGAAGKSGSLSAVAAKKAGAGSVIGLVPTQAEADLLASAGLADRVVIADARNPPRSPQRSANPAVRGHHRRRADPGLVHAAAAVRHRGGAGGCGGRGGPARGQDGPGAGDGGARQGDGP